MYLIALSFFLVSFLIVDIVPYESSRGNVASVVVNQVSRKRGPPRLHVSEVLLENKGFQNNSVMLIVVVCMVLYTTWSIFSWYTNFLEYQIHLPHFPTRILICMPADNILNMGNRDKGPHILVLPSMKCLKLVLQIMEQSFQVCSIMYEQYMYTKVKISSQVAGMYKSLHCTIQHWNSKAIC